MGLYLCLFLLENLFANSFNCYEERPLKEFTWQSTKRQTDYLKKTS